MAGAISPPGARRGWWAAPPPRGGGGARGTSPGSPGWGGAPPPAGGLVPAARPRPAPRHGGGAGYPAQINKKKKKITKLGVRRVSSRGLLEGVSGEGAFVPPAAKKGNHGSKPDVASSVTVGGRRDPGLNPSPSPGPWVRPHGRSGRFGGLGWTSLGLGAKAIINEGGGDLLFGQTERGSRISHRCLFPRDHLLKRVNNAIS